MFNACITNLCIPVRDWQLLLHPSVFQLPVELWSCTRQTCSRWAQICSFSLSTSSRSASLWHRRSPCFCRVRSRAWGVRPTVRFGIRHSTAIRTRTSMWIHLINGVLWQLLEERETRECKAAESIIIHFCNASKSGSNRTNTKLICFALNLLLGEDRCSDFYLKDFTDKIHSDSFCVKILKISKQWEELDVDVLGGILSWWLWGAPLLPVKKKIYLKKAKTLQNVFNTNF